MEETTAQRDEWAQRERSERTFGRYKLHGRLASGGMADVFAAELSGAGGFRKRVVIKRVRPHLSGDSKFVRMFLEEARIAARLSHPNICEIYELGEVHGEYFIAMEYLHGVSLARLLARIGRGNDKIQVPLVAAIMIQACQGLHHAHELRDFDGTPIGVVHRDISPHNLLVRNDGVVKVLDFGIAKAEDSNDKTGTGTVKGKHAYMSPEQLNGRPLDRRSDVWSLGVVLYEALAGRMLFKRNTPFRTSCAIMGEQLPTLSELRPDTPEALDKVFARVLCRQREFRYGTAAELGAAIAEAVRPLGLASAGELGKLVVEHCDEDLARREILFGHGPRVRGDDHSLPLLADPSVVTSPTDDISEAIQVAMPTHTSEVTVAATPMQVSMTHKVGARRSQRGLRRIGIVVAVASVVPVVLVGLWLAMAGERGASNDVEKIAAAEPPAEGLAPALAPDPSASLPIAPTEPDRAVVQPEEVPRELEPTAATSDEASGATAAVVPPKPPASAKRPARARQKRPARPKPAAVAHSPGYLSVDSKPWATIYVDGRELGVTPILKHKLSHGKHRIKAVGSDGSVQRLSVQVSEGAVTRRRLTW